MHMWYVLEVIIQYLRCKLHTYNWNIWWRCCAYIDINHCIDCFSCTEKIASKKGNCTCQRMYYAADILLMLRVMLNVISLFHNYFNINFTVAITL